MSISALVINLAEREDRREFTLAQARRIGLDVSFIEAVRASDVPKHLSELVGLSPARIACWLSHREAWRVARDSGARFALIMEDDVRWLRSPKKVLHSLESVETAGPDILQLGSLGEIRGFSSRRAELARLLSLVTRASTKAVPAATRLENWLAHRSQLLLQARVEIAAEGRLGERIEWGNFGVGAHAYVLKTEIVNRLLEYNCPPFLAADDALAVLAAQRTFLVGSLSVPTATQAPLPSDLR